MATFKPALPKPRLKVEMPANALGTRPAAKEPEEQIDCVVPRSFTLTDDTGQAFKYAQGRAMMPRSHAFHFYSKHNGVTPFEG